MNEIKKIGNQKYEFEFVGSTIFRSGVWDPIFDLEVEVNENGECYAIFNKEKVLNKRSQTFKLSEKFPDIVGRKFVKINDVDVAKMNRYQLNAALYAALEEGLSKKIVSSKITIEFGDRVHQVNDEVARVYSGNPSAAFTGTPRPLPNRVVEASFSLTPAAQEADQEFVRQRHRIVETANTKAKQIVSLLKNLGYKKWISDFDGTLLKTHTFHNQQIAQNYFDGSYADGSLRLKDASQRGGHLIYKLFADLDLLKAILGECKTQGIQFYIASKQYSHIIKAIIRGAIITEDLISDQNILGCDNGGGNKVDAVRLISHGQKTLYMDDLESEIESVKRNVGGHVTCFGGGVQLPEYKSNLDAARENIDITTKDRNTGLGFGLNMGRAEALNQFLEQELVEKLETENSEPPISHGDQGGYSFLDNYFSLQQRSKTILSSEEDDPEIDPQGNIVNPPSMSELEIDEFIATKITQSLVFNQDTKLQKVTGKTNPSLPQKEYSINKALAEKSGGVVGVKKLEAVETRVFSGNSYTAKDYAKMSIVAKASKAGVKTPLDQNIYNQEKERAKNSGDFNFDTRPNFTARNCIAVDFSRMQKPNFRNCTFDESCVFPSSLDWISRENFSDCQIKLTDSKGRQSLNVKQIVRFQNLLGANISEGGEYLIIPKRQIAKPGSSPSIPQFTRVSSHDDQGMEY